VETSISEMSLTQCSVSSRARPRSVLLSSSYARPYISPTTNITISSILSKDYRSRSQPPTNRIPPPPTHNHTNNVITRDSTQTPPGNVTSHSTQDMSSLGHRLLGSEESFFGERVGQEYGDVTTETENGEADMDGEQKCIIEDNNLQGGETQHGKIDNCETFKGGTHNERTQSSRKYNEESQAQKSNISGAFVKSKISQETKEIETKGKTERKAEGRRISKLFGKKSKKNLNSMASSESVQNGIFNNDESIIEKSKRNFDKFQRWHLEKKSLSRSQYPFLPTLV